MEWKTSIAKSSKEETLIRGYDIIKVMENHTFTEAIYLVLKGELPSAKEKEMLDALFVASIEHGISPPSTLAARVVASCGSDFNSALAAGILAIGEFHGGAMEKSARVLQEDHQTAKEIVAHVRATGEKLAGYGHKLYTIDPRARKLIQKAQQLGFCGKYVEKALEMENELEKQSGKKICLNIDGAIAAVISEIGFSWKMAQAFFIIPRIAGLSAHVYEEMSESTTYRRLDEKDSIYTGKERRELPQK